MNTRKLALFSLLLNAALGMAVWILAARHPQATPPVPAPTPAEDTTVKAATLRHFNSPTGPPGSRDWVSTLRDAGVPVRVLARVTREVFDDQWGTRQSQAQAAYMRGEADADSLAVMNLEHDREQEQALRAALGEADFCMWDKQNILEGINLQGVTLTDAQSDALYDLEKIHREQLNQNLTAKLKHEIDPATADAQQAGIGTNYESRLKLLLGEQNYAAMRGTPDDTAGQLQRDLGEAVPPSVVGFEAVLQIQNRWFARRTEMTGRIQDAKDQIASSQQELRRLDDSRNQELQRVLGDAGFEALQRGEDPNYQKMKLYAQTWGLDDGGVDSLYRTIQYYQKAVAAYQSKAEALQDQGQTVDWNAVKRNLQQFAGQTEQAVRGQIGDDAFNRIQSNQIFPFAQTK